MRGMTVGELRAQLAGVRDDAVILGEVVVPPLDPDFGMQFAVHSTLAIGGRTDDPGFILQLRRTR